MRRLAVLSLHTSPLAQPGTGDGGGMNVYVRELSTALARAGVDLRRLHPARLSRAADTVFGSSPALPSTTSPPGPVGSVAEGRLQRMSTSSPRE